MLWWRYELSGLRQIYRPSLVGQLQAERLKNPTRCRGTEQRARLPGDDGTMPIGFEIALLACWRLQSSAREQGHIEQPERLSQLASGKRSVPSPRKRNRADPEGVDVHEIIFSPQSAFACRAGAPSGCAVKDFEFIHCATPRQILSDAEKFASIMSFLPKAQCSLGRGSLCRWRRRRWRRLAGKVGPMQAVFGSKASSARLLVRIPGGAAKMSRAALGAPR